MAYKWHLVIKENSVGWLDDALKGLVRLLKQKQVLRDQYLETACTDCVGIGVCNMGIHSVIEDVEIVEINSEINSFIDMVIILVVIFYPHFENKIILI